MKAKVTARYWDSELQSRFGSYGSTHDLPNDTETFLKEVMKFGRFETKLEGDLLTLEFQNTYD